MRLSCRLGKGSLVLFALEPIFKLGEELGEEKVYSRRRNVQSHEREHVPGHVAGMGVYKLVGEGAAKKARGDQ